MKKLNFDTTLTGLDLKTGVKETVRFCSGGTLDDSLKFIDDFKKHHIVLSIRWN